MKIMRLFTIFVFAALIATPILTMNTEKDVVSDIDNRQLAEDPITVWRTCKENGSEFNWRDSLTSWLSDRIGFRSRMIKAYAMLYDKAFHEMKHPFYTYGKKGYVFFNMDVNPRYYQFHDDYVAVVKQIKDYCDARGVPCYFMFEPSKKTALAQYLPAGVHYNNDWVGQMLQKMRDEGIPVVDNTELLTNLEKEGTVVFNRKYNAGHWNDLGAFYGVNHLLTKMREDGLPVKENAMEDFDVAQEEQTSLQVSEFPIRDTEPIFDAHFDNKDSLGELYIDELEIHPNFPEFLYYANEEKKDAPKVMVFQGSYMNGMGYKFCASAFHEYISVHDYQNTMNFDYYYNIFKPEVVVIEVAEYACAAPYFDMDAMEHMKLNPLLDLQKVVDEGNLEGVGLLLRKGNALATFALPQPAYQKIKREYGLKGDCFAYLLIDDNVFDFRASRIEGAAYSCVVDKKTLQENSALAVVLSDGSSSVKVAAPIIENMLHDPERTDGVAPVEDAEGVYELTTDVPDNRFDSALLQLQCVETGEYLDPQGAKYANDSAEPAFESYTHERESGEYTVRFRANSNLMDEYLEYKLYLEQGATYYYQFKLVELSERKVTISGMFFGK